MTRIDNHRNKMPALVPKSGHLVLATSYSRTAYRRTTIGAAAFHCRVRNGNGWCHCATVTRNLLRCLSEQISGELKISNCRLQIEFASQSDAATAARSTSNFSKNTTSKS